MAWLRHSLRHVHRTVFDALSTGMTSLGWTGTNPPYGALPVTLISEYPKEFDLVKAALVPNKIAITYGIEFPTNWIELGGTLASQEVPFFADVYAETEGIALAMTNDIRDLLLGRFPVLMKNRMPVKDYSSGTPVDLTDWRIEFAEVERIPVQGRPEGATVRWSTVIEFSDVTTDA